MKTKKAKSKKQSSRKPAAKAKQPRSKKATKKKSAAAPVPFQLEGPPQQEAQETGHRHLIIIRSAKLKTKLMITTLNCSYHEQLTMVSGLKRKDISSTINREGENAIHDDLRHAFQALDIHLGIMTEMLSPDKHSLKRYFKLGRVAFDDAGLDLIRGLSDFTVTGFTITGTGDSEGITLIGNKKLSTGKRIGITTPIEIWSAKVPYIHQEELAEAVEQCRVEIRQYLEGKMAPPAQTEMEFEEGHEAEQEEPANPAWKAAEEKVRAEMGEMPAPVDDGHEHHIPAGLFKEEKS